jgi:hypothetical protein
MTVRHSHLPLEVSEASETLTRNGESEVFNASGWTDNGHMENARKPALEKTFGRFGRFEMGEGTMNHDDLVQRALQLLAQPIGTVKPTKQQKVLKPIPSVQPGSQITWHRAGKVQQGVLDYLHADADGTHWAFVSIGETWTAVNLKFVTKLGDE